MLTHIKTSSKTTKKIYGYRNDFHILIEEKLYLEEIKPKRGTTQKENRAKGRQETRQPENQSEGPFSQEDRFQEKRIKKEKKQQNEKPKK